MRNPQVVVVLQEGEGANERESNRERERQRKRGGERAQPAESRLPLKGKYPHSQHTPTNDKCRRGRGLPLTGWLSAKGMDRWKEGSQ